MIDALTHQPVTLAEMRAMHRLSALGWSPSRIGRLLGRKDQTVSYYLRKFGGGSVSHQQASIRRNAQRMEAFFARCNAALGPRPADALVMPDCDGPGFQPSL